MHELKTMATKVFGAGLFGSVTSAVSLSEYAKYEGLLRLAILMAGAISAIGSVISIFIIIKVNLHKIRIKAIQEVEAESQLCDHCRLGHEPPGDGCVVPLDRRPANCPKMQRKKRSAFSRFILKLMFSEDSTR